MLLNNGWALAAEGEVHAREGIITQAGKLDPPPLAVVGSDVESGEAAVAYATNDGAGLVLTGGVWRTLAGAFPKGLRPSAASR